MHQHTTCTHLLFIITLLNNMNKNSQSNSIAFRSWLLCASTLNRRLLIPYFYRIDHSRGNPFWILAAI